MSPAKNQSITDYRRATGFEASDGISVSEEGLETTAGFGEDRALQCF